jgi:hypothetical protein
MIRAVMSRRSFSALRIARISHPALVESRAELVRNPASLMETARHVRS